MAEVIGDWGMFQKLVDKNEWGQNKFDLCLASPKPITIRAFQKLSCPKIPDFWVFLDLGVFLPPTLFFFEDGNSFFEEKRERRESGSNNN